MSNTGKRYQAHFQCHYQTQENEIVFQKTIHFPKNINAKTNKA